MWHSRVDYLGEDGGIAGLPIRESFAIYQDAALTTPVNLTGYTARFAMRENGEGGKLLLEATNANSGITLGGVAGTLEVRSALIVPAHASLPHGTHAFALEVFNASSECEYVITGSYELRRRV